MNMNAEPHWPHIASRGNPGVKRIVALHERRARERLGLCWLESRQCVQAALDAGAVIDEIALSGAAQPGARALAVAAAARGVPIVEYESECFRKLSVLRHPDGIGAVTALPPTSAPHEIRLPAVVLWQLQDPGNAGSIVRSAAALGCGTVVSVSPGVDLLHPQCLRGTAGTIFRIGRAEMDANAAAAWLATRGSRVALLTADGATPLPEVAGDAFEALVVGSEAHGLPARLRAAHYGIAIPMRSGVESLNVNAAAAIALYVLWGRRLTGDVHNAHSALSRTGT
jgi:TrmH family RNA methyltransferase